MSVNPHAIACNATTALALLLLPNILQAECRQALAIGLDVSGSVDAREYKLQQHGLAGALLNSEVADAFLAMPGAPVRLFIYEWAGRQSQYTLVPWTDVIDLAALNKISSALLSAPRIAHEPATAIGQSMLFAAQELAAQSDCWRLTLDLSGDGQSNWGVRPRDVQAILPLEITINAIVIGVDETDSQGAIDNEISALTSYFRSEVIRGPHAFVEAALGFEDFERAMARKLLKELQTLSIGRLADRNQ